MWHLSLPPSSFVCSFATSEDCHCAQKYYRSDINPPARNQYMQEQVLGKLTVGSNTCGARTRTRANTGEYSWGTIFHIFAKFLGNLISVWIHAAPVFAPARMHKIKSFRIIYVLVSCQEVFVGNYFLLNLTGRLFSGDLVSVLRYTVRIPSRSALSQAPRTLLLPG